MKSASMLENILMHKRLLIWIFAISLISSCKKDSYTIAPVAGDNSIETSPPDQQAVNVNINANCAGYLQSLPARYDSSSKKYPLLLFVHGIGELGNGTTELSKLLVAGIPRLINKKSFPADFEVGKQHFSFIVISPQFKTWPTNADVKSVIEHALKKYRIDESRIYMTGLSMGGGVTWEYAAEYGSSLAAIVPVCGGSSPAPQRVAGIAALNLPVWAFHNQDDPTVPVSFSIDYVKEINARNPKTPAILTTWPSGGHDAWTKAYDPSTRVNGKNLYEWMLGYTHR